MLYYIMYKKYLLPAELPKLSFVTCLSCNFQNTIIQQQNMFLCSRNGTTTRNMQISFNKTLFRCCKKFFKMSYIAIFSSFLF